MKKHKITATRFHDFSCGHRVVGHEGKCAFLHGHNYRVHFTVELPTLELDTVGRVLDFSVIKARLCEWLEANWDHKFLAWDLDPVMTTINATMQMMAGCAKEANQPKFKGIIPPMEVQLGHDFAAVYDNLLSSIVWVSFNPTAENMAGYLLDLGNDELLDGTGARLIKVVIEETRKCSAQAEEYDHHG